MRKVGRLWVIAGLAVTLLSCGEPHADTDRSLPDPSSDSTTAYLRQPVYALDTAERAQLSFARTVFDFGRVRAGRTVRHRFAFTNIGPGPLRITEVTTSCGCTVSHYPSEPLDSGARSSIEVIFTTRGSAGRQHRPVVVQATAVPAQTTLYLSGEVIP